MNPENLYRELQFKAVRSSGAGGQHVNKVSTKVVLFFDVNQSKALSADEKQLLVQKLENRISAEGILSISCDTERSQLKNKTIVVQRFVELLTSALKENPKRKATKIPKSAIMKRIKLKRSRSEIKKNRQRPSW